LRTSDGFLAARYRDIYLVSSWMPTDGNGRLRTKRH